MEPRGIQQELERLLNEEIEDRFSSGCWNVPSRSRSGYTTVDGTLIEAWASHKSFRPKDGSGNLPTWEAMWTFAERSARTRTHESTTDPDARLFTKSRGSEAKLSYLGHVLMENRNGLLLQTF